MKPMGADPLHDDDVATARRTAPTERARQTLELMRMGYRLKRAALRARHPHAAEEEIEALFQRWLDGDDRS
jgi:hypothetical protein